MYMYRIDKQISMCMSQINQHRSIYIPRSIFAKEMGQDQCKPNKKEQIKMYFK